MADIKTTIDRAGRIVIPRPLREAAALEPGTDVEIRVTGGKLEIVSSEVVERRRAARRARLGKRALKSA
jgi:AbrB family looped-hinge helix DNA binding protein